MPQYDLSPQQLQMLQAMNMMPQVAGAQQQPMQPQLSQPFNTQPVQGQPMYSPVAAPQTFPQPFQPQAPAAQPQQQAPVNPMTMRYVAGPGVPAQLVGKTVQEATEALIRMSTQMAQMNQRPQQPGQQGQPQQQQVPQQQQPGQQIYQNTQQTQQPQTPAQITLESIQQVVQQTMDQRQLPSLIMQVEQSVAQNMPVYRNPQIRERVRELVGQLPAEQQAQTGTWDWAVKLAVGEQAMAGGQMPSFVDPNRQRPAYEPQAPRQTTDAMMNLPTGQQAFGQAFVEAPSNASAANMGQRPPMNVQEAQMASRLGLDPSAVAQFNSTAFAGTL